MKTIKKADQAKFDKARRAYQSATNRCTIADNAQNKAWDRYRESVAAACPFEEGDILTSSKIRPSGSVFKVAAVRPVERKNGPGYRLLGHFMKKNGDWYAEQTVIDRDDVLTSLVAYSPPAVGPKSPIRQRIYSALERVTAGEDVEVVMQSLNL